MPDPGAAGRQAALGIEYEEEQAIVTDIMRGFDSTRTRRLNHETQWQESSQIVWPEYANTFFYGYDQWPGAKKTQQQLDSHGSIASWRFAAICDSFVTPMNMLWSPLKPAGPDPKYLLKQRKAKEFYAALTNCVWTHRYAENSGFLEANTTSWQSLGVFGNRNILVDEIDPETNPGGRGLRYILCPVGHIYYIVNHQGLVVGYYRTFKYTAQQFKEQWPDTFPDVLKAPLEQHSPDTFWGLQAVFPRKSWQPWRLDAMGKRWASYYVCIEGHCLLEHKGYRRLPLIAGRYMVAPDEDYGRGPAQIVLPALKTKNSEKADFLTQGHRAVSPIYLTADDGLIDTRFHPGAVNKGGMSRDGKPLIGIVPTGQIQISEEMMAEEGKFVDAAFLVDLFKLALETDKQSQIGARQVIELIEQKGQLLGPTIGRQLNFYDNMIGREIDCLAWMRKLPPMPQVVKDYIKQYGPDAAYGADYDNPLMRALKASQAAGLMQVVEMLGNISQQSGNDEVFDYLSWKRTVPFLADTRGVPVDLLSTPEELQQKQAARQQQAEREASAKEMPAQAAMMKAQAITAKAQTGGNTGGTLSGTPQGGMPQIPGNPQGQPGQPGINGQPGLPGQPPRQ
jgi:hypothetical protein